MSLGFKIFELLREDILKGNLISGQHLVEKEICEKYNVSRTPVRSALLQLEMLGLAESQPNRGVIVKGITPQEIMDLYSLRKINEVQATAWAIDRIDNKGLEELEELFDFMIFYTMKKDFAKMITINENFHNTIYEATNNPMLIKTLKELQSLIRHNYPIGSENSNDPHYLDELLEEHRLIFESFKERNIAKGMKSMEIHLINSEKRRHIKF